MKRFLPILYLTLLFSIAGFLLISCGDSDDKDVSKPKVSNKTSSPDDSTEIGQQQVDFAAEEKAIREMFDFHTTAVKENKIDDVMKYWLKSEKPEVFVAHEFLGAQTVAEKWTGVKNFWAGTKPAFGGAPVPTTVLEVGIDKRARNATISGDFDWLGLLKGNYIAAFQKVKGVWKIRALDLGDKTGRIKQIKPPQ